MTFDGKVKPGCYSAEKKKPIQKKVLLLNSNSEERGIGLEHEQSAQTMMVQDSMFESAQSMQKLKQTPKQKAEKKVPLKKYSTGQSTYC